MMFCLMFYQVFPEDLGYIVVLKMHQKSKFRIFDPFLT